MGVIEAIKAHAKELLSDTPRCHQEVCSACGGKPGSFKLHERRIRTFRVLEEALVKVLEGLLGRWKCPLCGTTFTEYPAFAMPQKQYVSELVLTLSFEYVTEEECTYESAARGTGYAGGGQEIDERQLAPSTVWRWVSGFGALPRRLAWAQRLIREKSPLSGLFREAWLVPERKYRSRRRGRLLARVKRLFGVADEFRRLFGRSIFPDFATRGAFL